MNVIDRAMVHYTEQPREAGWGLMVSEASFGAGVSVGRVREGEKDVCGDVCVLSPRAQEDLLVLSSVTLQLWELESDASNSVAQTR